MQQQVKNNTALHRYEMVVGDHVAFADYRREGTVVHILHVETPPAVRGGGVAGTLMEGIVQQLRAEGLTLHPICAYAVAWLKRHPEHADMVRP